MRTRILLLKISFFFLSVCNAVFGFENVNTNAPQTIYGPKTFSGASTSATTTWTYTTGTDGSMYTHQFGISGTIANPLGVNAVCQVINGMDDDTKVTAFNANGTSITLPIQYCNGGTGGSLASTSTTGNSLFVDIPSGGWVVLYGWNVQPPYYGGTDTIIWTAKTDPIPLTINSTGTTQATTTLSLQGGFKTGGDGSVFAPGGLLDSARLLSVDPYSHALRYGVNKILQWGTGGVSITGTLGLNGGSVVQAVTTIGFVTANVSGTTLTIDAELGTGANQAAAGNDSRITGAAQKSANLSDLSSAATARTNLGLGTSATSSASYYLQAINGSGTGTTITNGTSIGAFNLPVRGWLAATFRNQDTRLWMQMSMSGLRWNFVNGKPFTDTRPGHLVHDPSWLWDGGTIYVCYNNHGEPSGFNTFSIVTTQDFNVWNGPYDVNVSAASLGLSGSAVNQVWAPTFFRDNDASIHITFAASATGDYRQMRIFEMHPLASLSTAISGGTSGWSVPTVLNGLPTEAFNTCILHTGSNYEIFFNHLYGPDYSSIYWIETASCPTLTGSYTLTGTGDWTGAWAVQAAVSGSNQHEGICIVPLSGTTRRAYVGVPTLQNGSWYSTMTDPTGLFIPGTFTTSTTQYLHTPTDFDQGWYQPVNDLSLLTTMLLAHAEDNLVFNYDGKVGIGNFRAGDIPTNLLTINGGRSTTDPEYQAGTSGTAIIGISGISGVGINYDTYGYFGGALPIMSGTANSITTGTLQIGTISLRTSGTTTLTGSSGTIQFH